MFFHRSGIGKQEVDNELYDRCARLWWDDSGCGAMASIRFLVNPLRFAFFSRIAQESFGSDLGGKSFLDVGCGGGFLSENFASLDLQVTGIDLSYNSVLVARNHAEKTMDGGHIAYVRGRGENLAFRACSFDLVACCDMLEHVPDASVVIDEISRVLKPGGLFFYETINRTPISWLMVIKAMQEWKGTSFVPRGVHAWKMFIKPKELIRIMSGHGLYNKQTKGLTPGRNMIASYLELRRLAAGKIGYEELGRKLKFRLSGDTGAVYIGYAVKPLVTCATHTADQP